ncbi:hypothetical protein GGX14DRAFT_403492 [Mycena pura]|uniref:Fungal-type protein kinase domain-containing protein n=1 Tax=Mycena pura TaxID=153505 RepID=A0AAD6Y2P6_9AGAR|nr:hypothetical protein GGX14DRAFT_403492 [Mycena pura]
MDSGGMKQVLNIVFRCFLVPHMVTIGNHWKFSMDVGWMCDPWVANRARNSDAKRSILINSAPVFARDIPAENLLSAAGNQSMFQKNIFGYPLQLQKTRKAEALKRNKKLELDALKEYEKTATVERDAMARSILPGQEPPTSPSTPSSDPPPVTGVVPSASSQILPTDSVAIEYPNKTLESVVATGIVGSVTTAERMEQHDQDAQYCARHFAGHVVHSPLDIVLARLGSSAFPEKLTEFEKVVHTQLDTRIMKAVRANFKKESKTSPVDRTINGRYWLSRLADVAMEPASLLALDYFPNDSRNLPQSKQHGYSKNRKYDACLRSSAADRPTIFNIFVNVEFTLYDPPSITSNPLIGATRQVVKYQQAIINADDLLMFQSTRLSVPTLSFHGRGERTKLFVSILSHERFEFAVIDNCFSLDKLSTVSALLHLFRIASLYALGYNPLFIYKFTSPPDGFSVGDVRPVSVVLPTAEGAVKVNLTGKRLSKLRSAPFQRSTVVLEGILEQSPGLPYAVVKMSFIAEHRVWREKIIVDALYTANVQPAPVYAPKMLAAFAAHGLPLPASAQPSILRNRKEPFSVYVPRHLEIMIFESPPNARKLNCVPSAATFLAAAVDLFEAILDAFRRRVLHRDISVNNILVADNRLLVVDWEIGRRFTEFSFATQRGTITGTLDTMSVASLNQIDPLPHDDVESAVYVLLKVLTQTFVPPEDLERAWAPTLSAYCWDDPKVEPPRLAEIRMNMWGRTLELSSVNKTVNVLRSAGHATRADLILSLLTLPLPAQRQIMDFTDHAATSSCHSKIL